MFLGSVFFAEKKGPGGNAAGLAPGVWSYPLAFRSLVVKPTALTQNFTKSLQIFELFQDHPGCVLGVVRGPQEQLYMSKIPKCRLETYRG